MARKISVQDFFERFPTDDSCLDHLMALRYGETVKCPKCAKEGRFARIKKIPAYSCPWCGHHIHPMQGTPFALSHTPLQKWFYAIYLFTTTRHGVSAKELQRQLSVTYKTAWRMGHEIRKYMAKVDGNPPLTGHVEVDETLVGGKEKGAGRGARDNKTVVFGILERGGELYTKIVPNQRRSTLLQEIILNVPEGTRISSDELRSYRSLKKLGYDHQTVDHGRKEYARGDVHVNSLESFWSILKRSIRSTHIHVSRKHLSKYLGEFEFRYNLRKQPHAMFDRLLLSF